MLDYYTAVRSASNINERLLRRRKITPSGCWEDITSPHYSGYCHFKIKDKTYRTHRVSYSFFKGDPKELFVCHTCDNKKCFNPEHLFLGTPADNSRDMRKKNRQHRPRGESNIFSKLQEKDVWEIRALLDKKITHKKIAEQFGVSRSLISLIKHKKSWGWL